jgi:hypothetical protein
VLFVTDSGQIEYGSPVQTRACQSVGIPNQYVEDFWNTEGREAVEEAIRRKRNTLTNSMKQRFVQYCKKPEMDEKGEPIHPPNPMKMIPLGVLQGTVVMVDGVSCWCRLKEKLNGVIALPSQILQIYQRPLWLMVVIIDRVIRTQTRSVMRMKVWLVGLKKAFAMVLVLMSTSGSFCYLQSVSVEVGVLQLGTMKASRICQNT